MPAYSFKERFVPMVLDGSKPHTIRSRRKKGFAKKGNTLYLYFGLRTKFCRKLSEQPCIDVRSIMFAYNQNQELQLLIFNKRLDDRAFDITAEGTIRFAIDNDATCKALNETERNQLAWLDGFRPDGSTLENPLNAFELMERWWKQTHTLPFLGDIIYWKQTPIQLP